MEVFTPISTHDPSNLSSISLVGKELRTIYMNISTCSPLYYMPSVSNILKRSVPYTYVVLYGAMNRNM